MSETEVLQAVSTTIDVKAPRDLVPADRLESSWIILCDFDGTISRCDVSDALIERFGGPGCDELEAAWVRGDIGSRVCMSGQIASLNATKAELDAVLDSIEIDPYFAGFVRAAQEIGIDVEVVSDGLDYAIHRILARFGLDHLKVSANRLLQRGDQTWCLDFPHSHEACRQASGNCKCRKALTLQTEGRRILFVGDGTSDFCVSARVDRVLAKDRLIDHCREHALAFHPISGFREALALLPELVGVSSTVGWEAL